MQAFGSESEKTYIDKVLGRREGEQIKILIKKDTLTRGDLLDLLHLLTSAEIKLANLDDQDRYILGKFFVWIREMVKIAEFYYDYKDDLNNSDAKKICFADEGCLTKEGKEEILRNIASNQHMIEHNIKYLCDIFLYIARSSVSLEALGFDTLTKARYEYGYGQQTPTTNLDMPRGQAQFKRP